jgi:hypothetical protein
MVVEGHKLQTNVCKQLNGEVKSTAEGETSHRAQAQQVQM